MPIIKQNDIIDVIYETICGYEPEEAYKILELYHCKRLIPIEWLINKCNKVDDLGMGIEDWSIKDCYKLVLEDWEKENEIN